MISRFLSAVLALGFVAVCSASEGFIHSGLLHCREDIARMKAGVARGDGPIHDGFEMLVKIPYYKVDYRMRGPVEEWGRAPNINTGQAFLNGRRMRGELIPEGSHPNAKGYAAWAAAMEPILAKLLGEAPVDPPK